MQRVVAETQLRDQLLPIDRPVLLEPVCKLEVVFPGEFAGEINQYLNAHRGRIQGMDQVGDDQVLRAEVPLAEIQTFSSDLRSMTQGQGSYTIEFSGYVAVPPQVQAQVVEKYQKDRTEKE